MDRFLDIVGVIIISICSIVAAVCTIALIYVCIDVFMTKDSYSYVMDDGTSGTADCCDNSKGGLYCKKDGRTFTVKEYSRK